MLITMSRVSLWPVLCKKAPDIVYFHLKEDADQCRKMDDYIDVDLPEITAFYDYGSGEYYHKTAPLDVRGQTLDTE